MVLRCTSATHYLYPQYGAQGITVHPAWLSYELFLQDMGRRPEGQVLARLDQRGNYTPENTRWVTRSVAERAKGKGTRIECRGEALTVLEWAERLKVGPERIRGRLRKGWTVEEALGFVERQGWAAAPEKGRF